MIVSWISMLVVILLGGALIGLLVVELLQTRKRAPFIPSSFKSIHLMLERIPLPSSGLVIDLGAGDGRFLRQVKATYPQLQVVGYEISLVALLVAHIWNSFSTYPVPIVHQNFLTADLSKANVIFCFLLNKELSVLEHKLLTELKPGTMVISNTFSFPNWQPQIDLFPVDTGLAGHIRVYIVNQP